MKTFFIVVFILTSVSGLLWGDLQDHYKKGIIILKESDEFGKNTTWEDYFYKPFNSINTSEDGFIFVVSNRQNCIYKFDKNGKLIKKFGQKGEGPGDMYSPGFPNILDGKYLVVNEYALKSRISVWDLDGNFVKVVRTKNYNFGTIALRENKIAYKAITQYAEKKTEFREKNQIIIKDIDSGKEKVIKEITLVDRSSIDIDQYSCVSFENYRGKLFMLQTIEGNMAVGLSNQPVIKIYSLNGDVIRTFNLKIKPIPVTEKYIKDFKAEVLADLEGESRETMNRTKKYLYEGKLKAYPKYDFSKFFSDHLPLYFQIEIDSEGNFLVFLYSDCLKNCKTHFQVYSKEGEFICETELDKGNYDFYFDSRVNTCFTSEGIIWYAMEKGDEEEIYRLYKSKF